MILSDILGDPLDMIASGPVSPDASSCADAGRIVEKHALQLSPQARELLKIETPKALSNVNAQIVGSVAAVVRRY